MKIQLFYQGNLTEGIDNLMTHKLLEERIAWEVSKMVVKHDLPKDNYQYTVLIDGVLLYEIWYMNNNKYKCWKLTR